MEARASTPEYQAALHEDRKRQAAFEDAERQRWAERTVAKPDPHRELVKEAQAMRDARVPLRQIAKDTGRSLGWVAKHTRKPQT